MVERRQPRPETVGADPTDVVLTDTDDVYALLGRLHPVWHRGAACRGMTKQFYSGDSADISASLQVCGRCEVLAPCRAESIADPTLDRWGVRGGMTAAARKNTRRLNKHHQENGGTPDAEA